MLQETRHALRREAGYRLVKILGSSTKEVLSKFGDVATDIGGATLPLLVAYMTDRSGNVGRSVSTLYFVNTLGAAAGAFIASSVLLGALGLSSTVHATAVLNAWLGVVVFGMASLERRTT